MLCLQTHGQGAYHRRRLRLTFSDAAWPSGALMVLCGYSPLVLRRKMMSQGQVSSCGASASGHPLHRSSGRHLSLGRLLLLLLRRDFSLFSRRAPRAGRGSIRVRSVPLHVHFSLMVLASASLSHHVIPKSQFIAGMRPAGMNSPSMQHIPAL